VPHYREIIEAHPAVDWFEVISENHMVDGGRPLEVIDRVSEQYPVVLHGVSLAIGDAAPLNKGYLRRLRALADRVNPEWVSDHLCWGSHGGNYSHDLLPVPYTRETLRLVVDKVREIQDILGRRFFLENPSTYLTFCNSHYTEWDFLAELAERADCGLLLDVNNIFVSACNHGFDPLVYLDGIDGDRVVQIHLAGHTDKGNIRLDTHDAYIIDEVWALYAETISRFGPISTLIEWDDHIPALSELMEEAARARKLAASVADLDDPNAYECPDRAPFELVEHSPESPIDLQQTQARFWNLITAPEGVESAVGPTRELDGFIEKSGSLTPEERLDVYANMYFFRLRDILADDFECVAAILGEVGFHNLVTDYLLARPSRRPSIAWVGEALPEFLETHSSSDDHPYLGDLAKLEWSRIETFLAKDSDPLERSALATVAPEEWGALRLAARPASQLFTFAWRVTDTWASVCAPDSDDASIVDPAPGATSVLVWRSRHVVHHREVSELEAACLRVIAEGSDFGTVCATLAEYVDDPATSAAQLLSRWVDDELLDSAPD
jgi:uncharacterized protein (UPF0276 family)